ncbi:hypothetical protein KC323_g6429 [Hortaea werneckii]|nr:hypothetical protein KC323_g6429 [Hortaea werneckii]
MHLGLEKKVVLVTGGTKGIGRTIVRHFLQEGAIVHFCSRTQDEVDAANKALAKEFSAQQVLGVVVDVANPAQLATWVAACAKESGRIDVAVANVSALSLDDSPESWEKAFRTDMMGTQTMYGAAIPELEKTKGNIVTISSVSGRDIDFSAPSPYGAMKAALVHYTAQLAHTLAPKGIRANTCSPGNIYIEDGVWGGVKKNMPEFFEKQKAANPMGRMGKPEEIADAVLFLASERASFVSGSNFVVDGALCTGVQL